MAKLVRARPKLPEFLPEWAKCCDGSLASFAEWREEITIADVHDLRIRTINVCNSCKTPWPEHKVARELETNMFIPLECYDLDEGTFAAAEQP